MKKILIVDDDQFFPKTLGDALPQGKYTILTAEDGEIGFEKLKSENPDLVILDLMMPKLDGTSFIKKGQEGPELSKLPLIGSSNLSSVKKISDVMTLGAVGYVIKSDESLESVVQDIERILNAPKKEDK